jgi:hypothetical protein
MDMTRSNDAIENTKARSFPGLKQSVPLTFSIFGELQYKLSFMAAVSNVPQMAGEKIAFGARHMWLVARLNEADSGLRFQLSYLARNSSV